jgi:alkanesulfonate monooxygenase SsuD/methylene tetrahydromethanopterin reductase-like flavin-dependent oxidoreductase (luciferase family)
VTSGTLKADTVAREQPFRLGIHVLTYGAGWTEVLDVVRLADALGYDYIFGADHMWATGQKPEMSCFEGWTSLAAWAAATQRANLGLLLTANSFRNPGLVAKMCVTVDHVSGGRALLGMGAGWWDDEHLAHGLDIGNGVGERLDWLDESLTIIRGLLAGDSVSSNGHYHFTDVKHAPLPMRHKMPVIVGATGIRKGLRVVARHADLWQTWIGPGERHTFSQLCGVLDSHCVAIGRDPATVYRLPGCKMILRDDPLAADSQFVRMAEFQAWPEWVRDHAWLGPPEEIAAWALQLQSRGAGGLIVQVAYPFDLETIERLAREVRPRLMEVVA